MGDPTGLKGSSDDKAQGTTEWVVNGLAAAFNFVARAANPGAAQFVDDMNAELLRRQAQQEREEQQRRLEAERLEQEREKKRRSERALALDEKQRDCAALDIHGCADEGERGAFTAEQKAALELIRQAKADPTLDAYKTAISAITRVRALSDAADENVRQRLAALDPLSDELGLKQPDPAATDVESASVATARSEARSAIEKARKAPTAAALQFAKDAVQATQQAVEDVLAAAAKRREAIEALQKRAGEATLDDGALADESRKQKAAVAPATRTIEAGLKLPTQAALDDANQRVEELELLAEGLNQQIADRRSRIAALQEELRQFGQAKGLLSVAQPMEAAGLRKKVGETRQTVDAARASKPDTIDEAEAAVARLGRAFADLVKQVDTDLGNQAAALRKLVADLERGEGPQGKEVQAVADANGLIGQLDGYRANVAALDFKVVHHQLQEVYLPLLKRLQGLVQARSAEPPMTPEQLAAWSRARALRYFCTNVPLRVKEAPWLGRQGPVLDVTVDARDTVLWQQIRAEFHGKAVTVPEGKTFNGRPVTSPVTYYVTQSSNSGFAFDISGHLWRKGAEVMSAIFVLHVSNRAEAYVDTEIRDGRL